MRSSGGHFGPDFCRLGSMSGLAPGWSGPVWASTICSWCKQNLEVIELPRVESLRMGIQIERTGIKSTDVR